MKRMIKSASIADEEAFKEAQNIYDKANDLLTALDNASGYVLDKYDLYSLYERLREDVPAMNIDLKVGDPKRPKYEDMW